MKKIITNLINKSGLTQAEIIREINKQQGCNNAIGRHTIHRWKTKIKSDTEKKTSNKKQKSIICWCIYFKLEFEEIYNFLNLLNYKNPKQIDTIFKSIEEQRNNQIYYFQNHESLLPLEFSKLIIKNKIQDKTTIIIEDNLSNEDLSFRNPKLEILDDHYIRSIIINDKSIGGSNATLEDIASNGIKFILSNDVIEPILSEIQYSNFNFYTQNTISRQNLNELCNYNEFDKILAYLKQDIGSKNCPLNILYTCLNKNISIHIKRKIFESIKVISHYIERDKCSKKMLNNFLDFIRTQLINNTDILSQIYIVESLGYFHLDRTANHKIWKIASTFFKKEIIHPHLVWSFLVTLNLNTKEFYSRENRKLIIRLADIVKSNSLIGNEYLKLLDSLISELKIRFY